MSTTAELSREECRSKVASLIGADCVGIANDAIVARVRDAAQIAEILSFANANGIAVTPFGSGTKQSWGNGVETGIRLDLGAMGELREHAWQDMTCTVEAGCTWSRMQAELARHGQMVALDPLWPERATVGGIVAANDGGSLRLKYGSLRDLIIGMTVVLADGTIAKTGGKVVKNVAGYDLHKLMTGSFGTLGVIAEVNFRLHPLETHTQTWTAKAADPLEFKAALQGLLDSHLTPSSTQLRVSATDCELDVKIAAPEECIGEHLAKLERTFSNLELKPAADEVWRYRQELHGSPDALVLKVSTLPSDICALASELRSWAAKADRDMALAAQANGLVTVALRSSPEDANICCALEKSGSALVQFFSQARRSASAKSSEALCA